MTAPSLREPRKRFYDSLPLEGGGGAFAVSDATTEGVFPVGSPYLRTLRRLWFKPCAPKKDEVISPRLFLAQRQGFEPW